MRYADGRGRSTSTEQWRRTLSTGAKALLLLSFLFPAGWAWGEESTEGAQASKRDITAIREKLERQIQEYRERRAARQADSAMRVFVDKKGVPTLTNRPQHYQRNQGEFQEVPITYDPITIPDRFRNHPRYTMADLRELVTQYCAHYGLSESLVYAVIRCESEFDPNAVSPAGARGLMQLMPGTAEEMGVRNIFDVAENVAGGTQYLAKMLRLFDGDVRLALAAYNAGPEAVKKYGGIPPFQETQKYVDRVLLFRNAYAQPGISKVNYSASHLARRKAPERSYVPKTQKKYYTIVFNSGLTQPAEKIVDADEYYFVQFDGRVARVKKSYVKEIVAPS